MFKFLKNLFKKRPPTVHPEEPEKIKKENTDDVKDIKKIEHHIIIESALGNSSNKITIPDIQSKQPPKIISPEKQEDNFPSSEKSKTINKGNINTRDIKEVEHHIVIGIDFGSSSSKVIVRDDHSEYLKIIYPEKQEDNFPPFAFPTRISIKNGKIYFCNYLQDTLLNFSYLKVCLICSDSSKCNNCDFGGKIVFPGKIFKSLGDIKIEELVTIFLSFLISMAKSQIEEHLTKERIKPKFFYHMGAPINKIDSKEKEIFEKCLFWAIIIASQTNITNGLSFSDVHNLYCKIKSQNPILPEEQNRNFFVLPESYAAVVTYLNSHKAKQCQYSIIDIGASTTDISVFWYNSEQGIAYFYHGKTYHIGCNDIDKETLEELQIYPHNNEDILFKIQQARHFLYNNKEDTKVKLFEKDIEKSHIEQNSKKVGIKIRKKFLETIGLARKNKEQRLWPNLNVFIIGGGSRIKEISDYLTIPLDKDENWQTMANPFQDTKLTFGKIEPFNEKIEEQDLLCIAAGLSIHLRKWVKYFPPSTVEPIIPVVKKFDVYERSRDYDG